MVCVYNTELELKRQNKKWLWFPPSLQSEKFLDWYLDEMRALMTSPLGCIDVFYNILEQTSDPFL